jgi:hypothetical protein
MSWMELIVISLGTLVAGFLLAWLMLMPKGRHRG